MQGTSPPPPPIMEHCQLLTNVKLYIPACSWLLSFSYLSKQVPNSCLNHLNYSSLGTTKSNILLRDYWAYHEDFEHLVDSWTQARKVCMVPASTQYTLPRLVRLLGYQKIRCLDRIQIKERRGNNVACLNPTSILCQTWALLFTKSS